MKKTINERIPFFLPFKPIKKGIVNADGDVIGKDVTDYTTDSMIIEGVACTEDQDLDRQKMVPKGFILDYFLKSGFINWNHQMTNNPDSIIGQPIEAKADKDFYIKGKLYSWSNLAKNVYQIACNLQDDPDSDRTLGFSVEGLGVEEEGGIISKTIITSCAVAPVPKNNNTYLTVCKGLTVEDAQQLRRDFIFNPFNVEVEKGVMQECLLDIKTGDRRLILDKNYNFEFVDYKEDEAKMSMSQAIVVLSKAVKAGVIKDDKREELKKIIKKAKLQVR